MVFISHASQDKPFARRLSDAVADMGLNPWLDEADMVAGDDLPASISAALAEAVAVIVVVSTASDQSNWLKYELRLATPRMIQQELVIVPVRIDDAELPPEIRSLLWADFRSDFDSGLRDVTAALARFLPEATGSNHRAGLVPRRSSDDEIFNLGNDRARMLRALLGQRVPDTVMTIRVLEARTGITDGIAQAQLLDVLSHVAHLVGQEGMTPDQQTSQIRKAEEHLRMAMLGAGENLILQRTAELSARLEEYSSKAVPHRDRGTLDGVPRHSELEELRGRIRQELDTVRAAKLSNDWDQVLAVAARFDEIAALCEDLGAKIERCKHPSGGNPQRQLNLDDQCGAARSECGSVRARSGWTRFFR